MALYVQLFVHIMLTVTSCSAQQLVTVIRKGASCWTLYAFNYDAPSIQYQIKESIFSSYIFHPSFRNLYTSDSRQMWLPTTGL